MCRRRRWKQNDRGRIDRTKTPVINMPATGQNITRLRKEAGLSVMELQEKLELASPQAIYRWQRGETIPAIDNLIILADIFGVTIDEIIIWKRNGD